MKFWHYVVSSKLILNKAQTEISCFIVQQRGNQKEEN